MRHRIDQILRWTIIALMAGLVVDVVWQVASRYLVKSPSTITDELARILLIWLSFLGGAYVSGQNRHVAITFLGDRLGDAGRQRLRQVVRSVVALFAVSVLVTGGGILVYTTHVYRQLTPAIQIPMSLVYAVGPLSGLLILFYTISDIRKTASGAT